MLTAVRADLERKKFMAREMLAYRTARCNELLKALKKAEAAAKAAAKVQVLVKEPEAAASEDDEMSDGELHPHDCVVDPVYSEKEDGKSSGSGSDD